MVSAGTFTLQKPRRTPAGRGRAGLASATVERVGAPPQPPQWCCAENVSTPHRGTTAPPTIPSPPRHRTALSIPIAVRHWPPNRVVSVYTRRKKYGPQSQPRKRRSQTLWHTQPRSPTLSTCRGKFPRPCDGDTGHPWSVRYWIIDMCRRKQYCHEAIAKRIRKHLSELCAKITGQHEIELLLNRQNQNVSKTQRFQLGRNTGSCKQRRSPDALVRRLHPNIVPETRYSASTITNHQKSSRRIRHTPRTHKRGSSVPFRSRSKSPYHKPNTKRHPTSTSQACTP